MSNGLNVVIGGQVSGALQAMTAVEQRTIVLQSRIARLQNVVSNTQSFDQLNRALALLRRAQADLAGIPVNGLTGLARGSNQATLAMTNLGRVVQDAPYGFIGIANNLNPLLESFQRLRATTGTTGGALRALGSSLLGAGGIGFAISLASSALVLFGDKLFGTGKKAKETADELKRVRDVIKETSRSFNDVNLSASGSSSDEIAKVSILSKLVQDQTKSYNERNNALNQLKAINKNYFGDLTLEASSLATLTSRVNEYSNALIAAAVVKEFSSDIAKATVEQTKQLKVYEQLGNKVDEYNRQLEKTKQFEIISSSIGGPNGTGGAVGYVRVQTLEYTKLQKKIEKANEELSKQGGIVTDLSKAALTSRDGLAKAIEQTLKLKPLTSPTEAKPEKLEVKPKSIVIDFNQANTGDFEKSVEQFIKYMFDKSVKVDFVAPILIPPEDAKQQGLTFAEMFGKEVNDYFKQSGPTDFSLIKAVNDANKNRFEFKGFKGLSEAQLNLAKTAETISGTLTPAFDNLISAIAKGENAFQAFGEGVKQVLVGVISKLVQTAILAAALSAIFPGGIGGAKGFGSIFSSLLGFGGARASGGPVGAGSAYLVGERGPELFVPNASGTIVPNGRLGSMQTSSGGSFGRQRQVVRGQNIILAYARTNRSQGRLGG